eukprot:CAMPEP_0194481284 /NCGR_PEP_ID=MMETSP0253-20130528/3779_1 /TAXON_ID=2966 /ORGANISM="Noctiluca scintillans" /LENGTH=58 /DNA_ID=CAMNT_0039320755 /DNA_START=579 /DNA_END=756 /DNA_ORIENTATION=+
MRDEVARGSKRSGTLEPTGEYGMNVGLLHDFCGSNAAPGGLTMGSQRLSETYISEGGS